MDRINKLTAHLAPGRVAADEPGVLWEKLGDGVLMLTLNRPKKFNALSPTIQREYIASLKRANEDPEVRVVVVTGAGRAFCVGADMVASGAATPHTKTSVKTYEIEQVAQINALKIDKPIIAAINGSVAGLGFVIAMMADIRFTVDGSKFTAAFAKRGLVIEHGLSWVLPRVVGTANAMDIIMSSRVFKSDEAVAMGVVNKSFPNKETLLEETVKYAKDMAKFCSPAALTESKRQIYRHWERDLETAFAESAELLRKNFFHPDVREGIASFNEKRDPNFEGITNTRIRDIQL